MKIKIYESVCYPGKWWVEVSAHNIVQSYTRKELIQLKKAIEKWESEAAGNG